MKKKILFISNRGLLPINDGHSRRSYNLLKELSELNDITLLFLYESKVEISDSVLEKYNKIGCRFEYVKSPNKKISINFIYLLIRSIFSRLPYAIWRQYSKKFEKLIKSYVDSSEFDIIHFDNIPIMRSVIGSNYKFTSITDHDVSYEKIKRISENCKFYPLKMFLYIEYLKLKSFEKQIFNNANLSIVVSEHDKNIFKKLCRESEILVAENGIDFTSFNFTGLDKISGRLVWLGGFQHVANKQSILYFLSEIYPLIKLNFPNVSLDIIGSSVTEDLYLFSKNDNSVKFYGFVTDPAPIIEVADVFIAPVVSGGGTKLKVLEAMSMKKAIVCTSVGCEGIDGVDNIHYVVADDPCKFSNCVVELLINQKKNKFIGENAYKYVVNRYGYKAIAKKIDDEWSKLVAIN